jgi:hypothetical protein
MDVRRRGDRYEGSVTRESDALCVPFTGVLELVAALERLAPDQREAAAGPAPAADDRPGGQS